MTSNVVPAWWYDKYRDLPVFRPKASPMSDDDREFHSDMLYLRDLLHDLWESCFERGHRITAMPTALFDELDSAFEVLETVKP